MSTFVRRIAAVGLVGAALAATGAAGGVGSSGGGRRFPALDPAALDAAIATRPGDQAAGAIARVGEPGQLWRGSTVDAVTGEQIPQNAHFHIGSISKTFEATVVLQLAAERRIDLDGTVQSYAPGLLPDGFAPITVRELLNMTSGLPDVDQGAPQPSVDEEIANRYDYRTFDQIIQSTLRPKDRPWPGPRFAPGSKQEYNSLGFRIAEQLVEQITGKSFKDEVTARILLPLQLDGTSVPEDDPRMPQPYLHGYLTNGRGELVDVSEQGGDPSNMISTPADLDHFVSALFRGRLLPPAQLQEMFTVPEDGTGKPLPLNAGTSECVTGAACYGAGLMATPLADGAVLWGKSGHDDGYSNGMFATRDLSLRGVYSVSTTTWAFGSAPALAGRLLLAAIGAAGKH
ncbi:D-alanyl-D-alanine carboxypeptidase [Kitasatospora sp. MAP12-15]|uniref:serine hydrolase domain-containing protein n=1 Tax=unclassified Kitasatospora TaxID=2633591 RepID=UPI002474FA87|nr:serine hydrolase domain-containing protein [Kitasatospora sp. MAP12-44]MDH6112060.1 D-alanyl-D-alanine carboxypeptidase [Kitasatospora sp. MAP12-44]